MNEIAGNTFLEVDLSRIKANLEIIRANIGPNCELMPVLKANAAGMGLEKTGLHLTRKCGIKILALAQVYEAARLREAGVETELLVMGGVPFNNIPTAIKHNIQMPVFNHEFANRVNDAAKNSNVQAGLQIKIETGLNRIGVKPGEELERLLDHLKNLPNIKITGVFTHFAESDAQDKSYSLRQLELFKAALVQLKQKSVTPRYIHTCNSAAAVWFTEARYTHIRPGRLLYGVDPNNDIDNRWGVAPAVKWYGFVTNIRNVNAGETLGYGRNYKVDQPMRVAILSFGYADGYNKNLVKKGGYVLVKGRPAPLLDMCMDQTFVDVTGIEDLKINDQAVLLGKDGNREIGILDFRRMLGDAYVNAMSTITDRAQRIYTE